MWFIQRFIIWKHNISDYLSRVSSEWNNVDISVSEPFHFLVRLRSCFTAFHLSSNFPLILFDIFIVNILEKGLRIRIPFAIVTKLIQIFQFLHRCHKEKFMDNIRYPVGYLDRISGISNHNVNIYDISLVLRF